MSSEQASAKNWLDALKLSDKDVREWHACGQKIVDRFRNERPDIIDGAKRFNILWSNVETLKPALYAQLPKPVCERRYRDSDEIGRVASTILERSILYHLDAYDFGEVVSSCVEDYLLPGKGIARVRYEPTYGDPLTSESGEVLDESGRAIREVVYEEARCEYVYWKDFRWGKARRWSEVPWVAFRSYNKKSEVKSRFGEEIAEKVKLTHVPEGMSESDLPEETYKKAEIWEIWDKEGKKVVWVSPGCDEILEESDPPLSLSGFFPCPKPLSAGHTSGNMIPVPDYEQYRDQAKELDEITGRISTLTKALRVVGVYAAGKDESGALQKIMLEGIYNQLIPVDSWAAYGEKGLSGLISWLPVEQIIKVVIQLYDARDRIKQEIYELTGIADIIRGASNPSETATAQRIKGQFATLRLKDRQKRVSEFVRDLIRLKAEVIAERFSPETLAIMTNVDDPLFQQATELLKQDPLRTFRIDIETDSTIEPDEQAEKQARTEFLNTVGTFMERGLPIAQAAPEMVPLMGSMILFAVRGFRTGRELEAEFEQAMEALKQRSTEPQESPPDPKMIETEAKVQKMQIDTQLDVAESQHDMQMEERKLALEAGKP